MRNLYATIPDFKASMTISSTSASDDGVINDLLERVSRYIDSMTGRQFYPTNAAKLYNMPDGRELWLADDLLGVTTITNGDATTIAAADYVVIPARDYPKYAIKLRDSSSEVWEENSDNSAEQVITITGIWGYHQDYANAWRSLTTLSAAIVSTSATTFTTPTGFVQAGMLLKVDSEYMHCTAVTTGATDTITVIRGANGSTAATHLISAAVSYWEYQLDVTQACIDIATSLYRRRYGESTTGAATVTAVGVVVTPRDVPEFAMSIIRKYTRIVL